MPQDPPVYQLHPAEGPFNDESAINGIPKDTNCYCEQCEFRRGCAAIVERNFKYGFLLSVLWLYNACLYVQCHLLSKEHRFSENIVWQHKDDIVLLNGDLESSLQDPQSPTVSLLRNHQESNRVFRNLIGWSCLGVAIEAVIIVLIVLIATGSDGQLFYVQSS